MTRSVQGVPKNFQGSIEIDYVRFKGLKLPASKWGISSDSSMYGPKVSSYGIQFPLGGNILLLDIFSFLVIL